MINLPEGWGIKSNELVLKAHGNFGHKLDYEACFSEMIDFASEVPEQIRQSSRPGFIYDNKLTGNSLQRGNDDRWRKLAQSRKERKKQESQYQLSPSNQSAIDRFIDWDYLRDGDQKQNLSKMQELAKKENIPVSVIKNEIRKRLNIEKYKANWQQNRERVFNSFLYRDEENRESIIKDAEGPFMALAKNMGYPEDKAKEIFQAQVKKAEEEANERKQQILTESKRQINEEIPDYINNLISYKYSKERDKGRLERLSAELQENERKIKENLEKVSELDSEYSAEKEFNRIKQRAESISDDKARRLLESDERSAKTLEGIEGDAERLGFNFEGSRLKNEGFSLSKEADGNKLDFYVTGSMAEIAFKVNGEFDRDPSLDKRARFKLAKAAKQAFDIFMKNLQMEPGHILMVSPYSGDTSGKARRKAYEDLGFGPMGKDNFMYAKLGENGELIPITEKEANNRLEYDKPNEFAEKIKPSAKTFYRILFG